MSGWPGMRPLIPHLIDFLDAHRVCVLATVDKAAMPRQSVVYDVREEQRLLISTESKGPAEILTDSIVPATAAIVHRIADLPEPPEAHSDEALAAIDRVILAITVEAVTAVNYLPAANEGAAS